MINPPSPVKKPTPSERVGSVVTRVEKIVNRNREIALVFFALIVGFVMGRL